MLETRLYLVVFDRVTVPATTDKTLVTGVDFRAATMPLNDAYVVMADSLKAFGPDTKPVDEWRAKIENRPTSGPSVNLRIEGGGNTVLGYLDIGGVYNPINGDNRAIIKYRINSND